MKRRDFLKTAGAAGLISRKEIPGALMDFARFNSDANLSRVEARFYDKLPDREIECRLCPRFCRLGDKERGYCGVRENIGGTYYTLVYGKACTVQADPIEKKPFFHFLPETLALSLATAGCNVNCKFCQNWEISQVRPEQIRHIDFPPPAVIRSAKHNNCSSIAYTYSEPVVFYEYMYDTSLEARRNHLRNVVVTGAHINTNPLKELLPVIDAIKVDLKGFTQDFYTRYVRGNLRCVLDSIKTIAASPVWLEIVYLLIPTLNDDDASIRGMCRWIRDEIGSDVPLHFSRFYPMYLLRNLPPTPLASLERAHQIALDSGLHFVYIGNVPSHEFENTYCPHCGEKVISRKGYRISEINLKHGNCRFCRQPIPGVWR